MLGRLVRYAMKRYKIKCVCAKEAFPHVNGSNGSSGVIESYTQEVTVDHVVVASMFCNCRSWPWVETPLRLKFQ